MKFTSIMSSVLIILCLLLAGCGSQTISDDGQEAKPITDRSSAVLPRPDPTPEPVKLQREVLVEAINSQMRSCMDQCADGACRNRCYDDAKTDEAYQNADARICQDILDSSRVEGCELNIKMRDIAVSNDVDECDSIENPNARAVCKDNYWMRKAVEGGNAALCKNIVEQNTRSACQEAI
ncbi:MAG: hypothetical protein ABIC95_04480 [archaeon]